MKIAKVHPSIVLTCVSNYILYSTFCMAGFKHGDVTA